VTLPLPEFQIARVRDIEAAITAKHNNDKSRFLAGGTDLIVNLRHGIGKPPLLIDLSAIDEMRAVTLTDEGARIGACVTIAQIAAFMRESYRSVSEAAASVAGPGVRTAATLGGNLCLETRCIYYNQSEWWRRANQYCLKYEGETCHVAPQGQRCHAAFSGDLAPALMVLGAEAEIASCEGRRRIPLADLYVEDGRAHLTLGRDELLVAVQLPANPPPSTYAKARARGSIDFPLAGVAVSLGIEKQRLIDFRVALTGTNSRPFLLQGTDTLNGRPLDSDVFDQLDRLIQKQVQPMRTTTASAHYRRLAAAGLARRLTKRLFAEAGNGT
jgi:4-hydroxybenzoyl-CoA reductase subunit beta